MGRDDFHFLRGDHNDKNTMDEVVITGKNYPHSLGNNRTTAGRHSKSGIQLVISPQHAA